jgi:hypothetical protein
MKFNPSTPQVQEAYGRFNLFDPKSLLKPKAQQQLAPPPAAQTSSLPSAPVLAVGAILAGAGMGYAAGGGRGAAVGAVTLPVSFAAWTFGASVVTPGLLAEEPRDTLILVGGLVASAGLTAVLARAWGAK